MKFSYAGRFPTLFSQIKAGGTPVCFFDQDGTVTVKSGPNESGMTLHPDVIPAVNDIMAKGGVYVPSSARSMAELKECYAAIPNLSYAANDGYVLSMPGKDDLIYGNSRLPSYGIFQQELGQFIADMEDVAIKDMGAYFGLFIDISHPHRILCEEFFAEKVDAVSAYSQGLPMTFNSHPMGITMEPVYNLGKHGVIDVMLPFFNIIDPILIVAGDGVNDIRALMLAKDRRGHAIKVHKGDMLGIPQYATGEVFDANDCVGLLTAIAKAMV